MKPEELLRALGEIDPEYIEEAETLRHKKKNHKHILQIAACIGLIVLAGGVIKFQGSNTEKSTSSSVTEQETAVNVDKGIAEKEEGKESIKIKNNQGSQQAPDKIYVDQDCYTRIEESIAYEKDSFVCMGALGDVASSIHAEGDYVGSKVYRIDAVRIMVEIDGKYYTYKK